jgi:16S rRNA (adenine1518-N6/adenine1519-N6)-dimethyltransferase
VPSLTEEVKSVLRRRSLSPRKRLGQNFLVNPDTHQFICGSLHLQSGDEVLEIGPGLGFLTRFLLEKKAKVIAVEKDAGFAAYLNERFERETKSGVLVVLKKDILKFDLGKEAEVHSPIKIAGNIPYSITSPILEWLVSQKHLVQQAVLMVQREVAERLCAKPGTKAWGVLSIFLQLYADMTVEKNISRSSFYPEPKVDSSIIKLTFPPKPRIQIEDEALFSRLVRKAFQKRRKTILNALRDDSQKAFSKESLARALDDLTINSSRRPETLSLAEWASLAGYFSKL